MLTNVLNGGMKKKREAMQLSQNLTVSLESTWGHASGRIDIHSRKMQSLKSSVLQRQAGQLKQRTAGSSSRRAVSVIRRTATPQKAAQATAAGSGNG